MTKAEKTKQYIIAQTATLFNKKGYAGTSLQDITTATGLTKGSIYGNFGGKDEVALAVFDYNISKVKGILRSEVAKHHTIKGKLMAYVDVYTHFPKFAFPDGGCPMLNTAVEADDTHPQLKQKARDAILRWKKSIETLIEKGMKNGEIVKPVDPEQMALTIMATIEGMIMIAGLTGKPQYRKTIMLSVSKMIEDLF
ncbi:TetR/AcrR family transcriptional regulator [Taibaiella koreensis]|uniref:TetR/AcrR family transcriptional regulator n=1 Tax=Taibaiella koreensis TaxID=1268548 RepID=UPI000E59DB30|nr:TetR/AcrR family transcriptional regulator [Taibaiella koreensis]